MQMDYWMPKVYPWRLAFGDFGENGKSLPESWRFNLEGKSGPFSSGNFCEICDFGENGKIWQKWPIWHKWRYPECGRYSNWMPSKHFIAIVFDVA